MQTNITMILTDRKLGDYTIRQQTSNQFLCLSDLQEAYTRLRIKNGWSVNRIENVINSKFNIERIYYIMKKQGFINTGFPVFIEKVEKQGVVKTLKEFGAYKTTGARENKITWCNPYIWVLVAMEMNPSLYADVVCWLTDSLIINRIEAGNFYKDLSRAVSKYENVDYIKLAKSLNYKIFGRHETGIRNLATQAELKRLYDLEQKIAFVIDMGHLKTFDDVIKEINNAKI